MTGQWFSPGTSVSSTNKTDRHDITEILLKVAFNTINLNLKKFIKIRLVKIVTIPSPIFLYYFFTSMKVWCLMPLSTIFQLYCGGKFYWWRKPKYPEKAMTCRQSLTNFILWYCIAWVGFKLTMLEVIYTDCIGFY